MDWADFLFSFAGRINRAKYWLWILIYVIASLVMGILIYVINSAFIGDMIQVVFGIAAFVSSLAITTKRLHDRNKSAVWLLLFVLAPSALLGIGAALMTYGVASDNGTGAMGLIGGIFVLAGVGILIWAFVELGCMRGTIGPNRFGPDPLEINLVGAAAMAR